MTILINRPDFIEDEHIILQSRESWLKRRRRALQRMRKGCVLKQSTLNAYNVTLRSEDCRPSHEIRWEKNRKQALARLLSGRKLSQKTMTCYNLSKDIVSMSTTENSTAAKNAWRYDRQSHIRRYLKNKKSLSEFVMQKYNITHECVKSSHIKRNKYN